MDSFTIATGVAGLVSLTIEIHGIVSDYISGAKSATTEAHNLLVQITTLQAVMDQLVEFLRSQEAQNVSFDKTAVLVSVITACQAKIQDVYKKLDKICKPRAGKIRIPIESAKWPFKKDEDQ
jgi:hypothetical protein